MTRRPASFAEAMATPFDRGAFLDSLEIHLDGGCGVCDTEADEMCAACGRCRCDRHDTCTRPTATQENQR